MESILKNKQNDKRGVVPLAVMLIGGIIALALIIILIVGITNAIMKNILLILGIGVIATSLFLVMKNPQKSKQILTIGVGIGITLIVFHSLGFTQQTALETNYYIETPFFGTVQCSPQKGGTIISGSVSLDSKDKLFKCPSNTKQCDILFSFNQNLGLFSTPKRVAYKICDQNGNNCGNYQYYNLPGSNGNFAVNNQVLYTNLGSKDSSIKITLKSGKFPTGWEYSTLESFVKYRYVPYVLWKQDSLQGGLNPISGSTDCKLPTLSSNPIWSLAIISSDVLDNDNNEADTSVISQLPNYLEPDDVYNYLSGTVTRASFGNVIDYKGQKGYCAENVQGKTLAQIYKIGKIETNSYIYNVVDTSTVLGEEQCCNVGQNILDQYCASDYTLKPAIVKDDGTTNIPCPCNPGRFILAQTDKTTFEYSCVDNFCKVSDIQTEDCITNEQCTKTNEICVNYKCIQASIIPGQIIEDKDGNSTGSGSNKCNKLFETEYTTEKVVKNWWNYIGIGKGTLVPVNKCVTKGWVYAAIGGIVLVIIISILYIKPSKKGRGKKRK